MKYLKPRLDQNNAWTKYQYLGGINLMERSKIKIERLLHKGAEASLYFGTWFGKEVIFKQRIPKEYRIKQIDEQIRLSRTLNEARALIRIKNYGINVPQVFDIDVDSSTIIMKYINGKKLKDLIPILDQTVRKEYLFIVGTYISKLHQNGHIHGDITTSNIIITPNQEVFLIDFGLHQYSDSIEDKSVDLHLFKRVLISSHGAYFDSCFSSFLEGYRSEYIENNSKNHVQIIKNIKVIESRGRYVKQGDRT
ncbi:MAG: Kae1-associated serine/threonine protein kinase [Promethearchaeota archaeon]|nr:MAG: Kae1-associated serine/threonine protein kinase [Candidatus Lokiarchaeota archaeon]